MYFDIKVNDDGTAFIIEPSTNKIKHKTSFESIEPAEIALQMAETIMIEFFQNKNAITFDAITGKTFRIEQLDDSLFCVADTFETICPEPFTNYNDAKIALELAETILREDILKHSLN